MDLYLSTQNNYYSNETVGAILLFSGWVAPDQASQRLESDVVSVDQNYLHIQVHQDGDTRIEELYGFAVVFPTRGKRADGKNKFH